VFAKYAGLDAIACRQLYPVLVAESQSTPALLATETWLGGPGRQDADARDARRPGSARC
jgi:hypothetical protein